ncbi:PAS domain-containing sensor histidine kinase [Planktothrix pseudagardhii]|uniref:histidine kinase n=1 Tax=Planktothrix pseudagardhii TaxID=132604 RepID=A0A9W4CW51_9CYAN|nr:PAS domain S-box protein [Planktothrix pseudagardhii]CAD5981297.1 Sensor protein kinase WalK [Planktothrix pseudagardhii]
MAISEVVSSFPEPNYQVIYASTWDERWQINQLLGVIHDLILMVDSEHQEIQVLPTQAPADLTFESNRIELILQQLQNKNQSPESISILQAVLTEQRARKIIYEYNHDPKNYRILTEIYPLSTTVVMVGIKDISDCPEGEIVLQNPSKQPDSKTPLPALQTTHQCLRKQIEERQRLENHLHTRKTELETLMDNAGDCIVRLDQKFRYLYANRRVTFLLGIPQKKLLGKTNQELGLPLSICKQWDWHAQLILDTGRPQQFEFDLETDEGYRSFQTLMVPEVQYQGKIKTLLATTRDITQQKTALAELKQQNKFLKLLTEITLKIRQSLQKNNEELELRVVQRTAELETANERLQFELMQRHRTEFKLRKSEEQYRTLVKNFPNGAVFLVDPDFRYTIADGMGLVAKGLSRYLLEGKTIWQALPSSLLKTVEPLYRSALAGEVTISEVEYDGRIYYHQALPVRNEQGEILAGMVVMQDITESKQAEAERDKLIAIIEATPDFISSAKPEGEVVYYNQSARRMLGLDIEGKITDQIIPKNHPQWANNIIDNEGIPTAVRDGSWIGETSLISYDGREIPLSQLIIAHKNNEGQVHLLSTIARDITEQKQSQANLREAERRWRSLLENVRLLVVGLDRQGKVEYVNPFFLEITGYTQTEVLGKNWLDSFKSNPTQRPSLPQFSDLLDYYFKPYDQQLILTKSGEEKIIAWNNTVLKNLQGNAIGMMSIGEDITERYAIERMKDEFISVVSHELRTPLTSIHGGLNLLSTGLVKPNTERGQHVMKIAAESAERLVRLVNDILELERLESGKICLSKQEVNATDLLLRATEQMQVMANRAGINLQACSQNLEFYADPDRILQVLTNLLSNAIKFSESGDTVWLSVQEELGENSADNRTILFKIQDQGRGIPPDKIERIFERFHQVDASDSRKKGGTGLGLAICRSIVEQHGGRIWVNSQLDEGSCFYFTLPIERQKEVNHDHKTNFNY